jgi:uncharacterized repeat protein (TIGR02543 family)
MNKHVAKTSNLKKVLRNSLAGFAATLLALTSLTIMSTSAKAAITLDVLNSTFKFDYPTNGSLISGANKETSGSVVKYSNVTSTPVDGVNIDAVVTMTLNNSSILPTGSGNSNGTYDSPGKAGSDANFFQVDTAVSTAYGYSSFKFDFYEAGTYTGLNTGTPVILKNLSVTTIDIDGGNGYCQYTDFTGFQTYYLSSGSAIQVKTNSTDPSTVPAGVTRFFAGSCSSNSNRIEDAAQIKFDAVSTFTTRFGTDVTANINYFGIGFKTLSDIFGGSQPAGVNNPSNQPPTSTDTTRYYVNGQASLVQLQDFGNYDDADGNPFSKVQITSLPTAGSLEKFVNGSWVAVALNDEILVTDITNGNLRYTGTVDSSLQFKVSDGNSYSATAYTMTLLVSNQSQTITFTNPGAKTPTSPSFASGATASSGLTVTLTSLTPGVCAVSGLNIVPVASGTCTIVASQAGNSTYGAATSVSQTFPISTLTPQTITAPNPGDQTWGGSSSTITVSPTSTSGLTVSLFSLNPSVCTVSGFVITIVGPGNCTIRNSQSGNGTYSSAPLVEYTFAVSAPSSSYTITYFGNGASGGSAPADTTGSGSVTLATNSGNLENTGFTFDGWNTQANGGGTTYAAGAQYNLTANVSLYAKWTAVAPSSFTITYDGNGKDGGSVPSASTGNGTITLAGNSGTLTRTGYNFLGWNTSANGTGTHYNTAASYNLTADVTLYAEWEAVAVVSYTITFDGNTNSGGTVPVVITGSGNKTLVGNTGLLLKTNYTFKGWNTSADGTGTHYNVGATYNLQADVTLYAEWTLTPALIYSANGATGGTKPGDIAANTVITIDANTGNLVRAGYRFLGWNTEPDGSGTSYAAGATPILPVGTVLYAEWEPVESLASTGSDFSLLISLSSMLLGAGMFLNAVSRIRRRRS